MRTQPPINRLLFDDVTSLRHIETVKELGQACQQWLEIKEIEDSHLPDILVSGSADLLEVGGALRNILEGVAGELELILDVGRGDDLDTGESSHTTDVLLTEVVSVQVEIHQSHIQNQ